jgi:hypothetical protein
MLALTAVRELSTLEDDVESRTLEVWLVVMLALTAVRELSILEEEVDRATLEV